MFQVLKCCNSRLASTRTEACVVMYLLMRNNFEHCKRTGFTRVHLQMVVAVSQLVNNVTGLNSFRFFDSLSVINSYAHNDVALRVSACVNPQCSDNHVT